LIRAVSSAIDSSLNCVSPYPMGIQVEVITHSGPMVRAK